MCDSGECPRGPGAADRSPCTGSRLAGKGRVIDRGEPPFILGWDIGGVVDEAPQTWRFRPGDEVFGMPLFPRVASAYAEVVSAPALHLARRPASLSHVEASALPVVGLTAWQGLVDLGGVTEGDRVLLHGGGGGVGHVAIQIAKALGAHVIATASGSKRKFVEGFGGDGRIVVGVDDPGVRGDRLGHLVQVG
ncbi:hypothetical protein FraQA3DRAFT_2065 [Frankia sp. QA3]|nr:hypothetical protein FraQA3DRAFT_2065 [Frankia sp. QA3]